jgi:hypothetical protein
MDAVYDRWHLNQENALNAFQSEPTTVIPAPALEKNYLHQINDGFVSGGDTRTALEALKQGCGPLPSLHSVSVPLHLLPRAECEINDALCSACRAAAKRSPAGREEVMLIVAVASEATALKLLLSSAKRAGMTNLVIAAADPALGAALGDTGGVPVVDGSGQLPAAGDTGGVGGMAAGDTAGGLGASAGDTGGMPVAHPAAVAQLRWLLVRRLLGYGIAIFSASAATLLISDPFRFLYRDADVEAMSLGWDDPSAYGYNHVIDDPSMGFTRYCHGSRIVGYEPNLFYASPTPEAAALAGRMGERIRAAAAGAVGGGGTAAGVEAGGAGAADAALRIAAVERESFTRELWLPSRNEYAHSGAILRVMNYLCFANSKVLTRQQQQAFASHKPVLVNIDYHADAALRMAAAAAAFVEGNAGALRALPASDTSGGERAPCEAEGRVWKGGDGDTAEAIEVCTGAEGGRGKGGLEGRVGKCGLLDTSGGGDGRRVRRRGKREIEAMQRRLRPWRFVSIGKPPAHQSLAFLSPPPFPRAGDQEVPRAWAGIHRQPRWPALHP